MNVFADFEAGAKKTLVAIWNAMDKSDRDHFINQVALALSIWGADERGKKIVIQIIRNMLGDGSKNLADFGLYVEFLDEDVVGTKSDKVKRVISVLESYRFKHDLPSEPSKDFLSNENSE